MTRRVAVADAVAIVPQSQVSITVRPYDLSTAVGFPKIIVLASGRGIAFFSLPPVMRISGHPNHSHQGGEARCLPSGSTTVRGAVQEEGHLRTTRLY